MKTLGSIVTYKKGKPPKTGPHGRLPVLSPHYLRTGQIEEMAELTPKDVMLKGGELILLWDGSNAGEFFRARAGVLSSTMVVFNFDEEKINPDYLYYDLKRFEPELKGRTAGSGIPHVDKEVLLARRVFEGGPEEQKAAAKVLLKVDRAIEQTEALLAKQQRIKTGLMHDMLTRGLDAHGQLRDPSTHQFKPSALGPIPVEWETVLLSSTGDITTGSTPATSDKGLYGGAIPFVTPADIPKSPGVIAQTERTLTARGLDTARALPAGAVCVVCIGSTIGKVGFTEKVSATNQQINSVIPADADTAPFLFWAISNDIPKQLRVVTGLQAVPIVNKRQFAALLVRRPKSPEEAVAISMILKCSDDNLSATTETLAKLQRLKSGLMHDILSSRVPVTPLLANPEIQILP